MKWLRTFSIVECLKKLVERRTRNTKVCFRCQVSIEAQFVATKIFSNLIQMVEKLKNHFLPAQKDIKKAKYFLSIGLKDKLGFNSKPGI